MLLAFSALDALLVSFFTLIDSITYSGTYFPYSYIFFNISRWLLLLE